MLKPMDFQIMWELIKDSRKSDMQLAKIIGVSQPTVTRKRTNLEKGFIEGYAAIPNFDKIGFKIVAFTFVKSRLKYATKQERNIQNASLP
jgi:DNA-binding Lrp family transcriptional regulator